MDRSLKRYLRRTSNDLVTLASLLLQRADNIQRFITAHDQMKDGNGRTEDTTDSSDEGCGSGEMMALELSTDSENESEASTSITSDQSSISSESITEISETAITDSDSCSLDDSQPPSSIGVSDVSDF